MRTLFKGGTVVSGGGVRRGDLLVENEKVAALGRNLKAEADRVIDVSGCYLFPGFVDAHTHFDLEVAGTVTADGFASGSRAALRGGTTTVIDFACPDKGESLHSGLERWRKKADGQTFCDYGFHMTIDDWNEAIRGELPDMFAQGISSFKMYMTYPAMMLGDRDLYWALKELRQLGGICGAHCENAGVIDGMIAERRAAGELIPASHALTRWRRSGGPGSGDRPSMWKPALSICFWTKAFTSTPTRPPPPGTSARRPCGIRRNRRPSGRRCGGGRFRLFPPITVPSPWSRKPWDSTTLPVFPAVCPAWRPGGS